MFERFTADARDVVVRARDEARALGHSWVGTEHLLLAALRRPDVPAVSVLLELGASYETCRAAVQSVLGEDRALGTDDAAALRILGIDLDEVRRRVEEDFGPGALEGPPESSPKRGILRRRRWRRTCPRPGHLSFMPRAKRALERSLREALALNDRHIGVEHIVLGLLDPKGNLAVDTLARLGVSPLCARALMMARRNRAA